VCVCTYPLAGQHAQERIPIIGFCTVRVRYSGSDGIRSLGSRCFFSFLSYCIFGARQSRHAGAYPLAEFTENGRFWGGCALPSVSHVQTAKPEKQMPASQISGIILFALLLIPPNISPISTPGSPECRYIKLYNMYDGAQLSAMLCKKFLED